jgi:hypothetical protein
MVAEPTNKLTTKRYTGKYFFKKRIKKSILPTSLSGYAACPGPIPPRSEPDDAQAHRMSRNDSVPDSLAP